MRGRIVAYALKWSYVKNLSGYNVASRLEAYGDLDVYNDSNFFRVAISPEFKYDSIGGCGDLNNYELGSIVERRVVSYSALACTFLLV